MSFRLSNELEDGYWSHSSGGEHAQKHLGDVWEINKLRQDQGLQSYGSEELYERLLNDGIVTVRQALAGGGAGKIAGYVVAERRRREGRLQVDDLMVLSEHRGKGIGGFLLGKLITGVPHDLKQGISLANYGTELNINGGTYKLPGLVMAASEHQLGAGGMSQFKAQMPKDWSGVRSLEFDDGASQHEVFVGGVVVGQIDKLPRYQFRAQGSDRVHSSIVFAAIDVLNPQLTSSE